MCSRHAWITAPSTKLTGLLLFGQISWPLQAITSISYTKKGARSVTDWKWKEDFGFISYVFSPSICYTSLLPVNEIPELQQKGRFQVTSYKLHLGPRPQKCLSHRTIKMAWHCSSTCSPSLKMFRDLLSSSPSLPSHQLVLIHFLYSFV